MMAPMRRPKKAAKKRVPAAAIETGVGSVSVDAVRVVLSVASSADQLHVLLAEQTDEILGQFLSDGYGWARLATYAELSAILSLGKGGTGIRDLLESFESVQTACAKPGRDLASLSSMQYFSTVAAAAFVRGVREACRDLERWGDEPAEGR